MACFNASSLAKRLIRTTRTTLRQSYRCVSRISSKALKTSEMLGRCGDVKMLRRTAHSGPHLLCLCLSMNIFANALLVLIWKLMLLLVMVVVVMVMVSSPVMTALQRLLLGSIMR